MSDRERERNDGYREKEREEERERNRKTKPEVIGDIMGLWHFWEFLMNRET